ncbi:MAG TPA: hypothetical protein VHT91_40180 [Kofleriaceae bacterium]|nr:hypothetical protein [Kofleriaceae bacterium]
MRGLVVLLLGLTACNAVLGIEDVPLYECQTNLDCAGNELNQTCSSLSRCVAEYQVVTGDGGPVHKRVHPNLQGDVKEDVPTGATLGIVCQTAHGDQVDGRVAVDQNNQPTSIPFKTWDLLDDDLWVYDGYMTTPRIVQGYSPGIKHCPGG